MRTPPPDATGWYYAAGRFPLYVGPRSKIDPHLELARKGRRQVKAIEIAGWTDHWIDIQVIHLDGSKVIMRVWHTREPLSVMDRLRLGVGGSSAKKREARQNGGFSPTRPWESAPGTTQEWTAMNYTGNVLIDSFLFGLLVVGAIWIFQSIVKGAVRGALRDDREEQAREAKDRAVQEAKLREHEEAVAKQEEARSLQLVSDRMRVESFEAFARANPTHPDARRW